MSRPFMMIAAIAAAFACGLSGSSAKAEIEVGAKGPEFKAKGIDGKDYNLENSKGEKATVLVFTCNNCPVAVAYEDRFIDFQKKHKGKDVKFIAINTNPREDLAAMKERAEEKGINYPYVFDESGDSVRDYGARVTPHVFVLDGEGKVAYVGSFDNKQNSPNAHHVENAVAAILEGKSPEVTRTDAFGCGVKANK